MLKYIFAILIFLGIGGAIINGTLDITVMIFDSSKTAFEFIISLVPIMLLWMGLLNIAEKSGLLSKVSRILRPFLKRLFPNLHNDKALEYISSNVAANMLGLGSAATPFGLKAMQELAKENKNKGVASKEMITFLVLNTSGLTIIPTTIIGLRTTYLSSNPGMIIIPSILATLFSTLGGLLMDYIIRKRHE